MSEFFIYALSNFSWYGHPTPKNILGVHWDMTRPGEIMHYLAVNTTENSTTLWNYRWFKNIYFVYLFLFGKTQGQY